MRIARILTVVVGLGVSMARPDLCLAAESATASVVVTAQFGSRTSLKVSTELLQFDVTTVDQSAVAIVDFSAAARTRQRGEVLLTVERAGALSGPGGAADVETSLTVTIHGDVGPAGALDPSAQIVAGRWVGQRKAYGAAGVQPALVGPGCVFGTGTVRSLRTVIGPALIASAVR